MKPISTASKPDKSLYKSIFIIAIPIIIQNIVQHFQMLIDRAFLGNLDAEYLAAIGNVHTPFSAMISFLFAAATGITVVIAQKIGGEKIRKATRYAEVSFFYTTLFAAVIALAWIIFPREILSLMGAAGAIREYGVIYIRIIAFSIFFIGIDLTAASILQAVGRTKPIMIAGIAKNLINIGLDWLLIFGKAGFPAMGLEGAALATAISNLCGTLLLFLFLLADQKSPIPLSFKGILRPSWRYYRRILSVGIPAGLEFLLWQVGQIVIVRILNGIDSMAIGVYILVNGIYIVAAYVYQGFARSALTLVGQKWGAGRFQEAVRNGQICQLLSLGVCILFSSLMFLFSRTLLGLFTTETEIIARAVPLLRIASINVFFQCINIVTGNAIRATGDTRWMLYSQIFGTIFVVTLANVGIFVFELGLLGLYLTMGIDELIRATVNYIRFTTGKNPFKKRTEQGALV